MSRRFLLVLFGATLAGLSLSACAEGDLDAQQAPATLSGEALPREAVRRPGTRPRCLRTLRWSSSWATASPPAISSLPVRPFRCVQRELAEQGTPFRLVNAGVSGDTSAGGLRRIDWVLRQARMWW